MTLSDLTLPQQREAELLEQLGAEYEEQGFTFTIHPEADELPEFLGSYRPDAVARKPGTNIAFEVKQRLGPGTAHSLKQIRRLIEGHPDWRLVLVYAGDDPLASSTISRAKPADIGIRLAEVSTLASEGHRNAAFVLAWSLLEAAARTVSNDDSRPQAAGTSVQTLATLGYIEPEVEQRLRALIDLRNKVVHGDLAVTPTADDIILLVSTVRETLGQYASDDTTVV